MFQGLYPPDYISYIKFWPCQITGFKGDLGDLDLHRPLPPSHFFGCKNDSKLGVKFFTLLLALVLLDACVSNSGREFQKNVSSQDFINEMRPLVGRADLVGEKIRELIQKWTNDFQDDAELSLIVRFFACRI